VSIVVFVALWLGASCAALAFAFRREIAAAWNEPVLRAPVLILESDDWGYGPVVQAERLEELAALLGRFEDRYGRHPVMTLGVVLGGPDTERIRADRCEGYSRITLADARLAPVREAMLRGAERGVFALQLHGAEHYWPDCLMRAAATDAKIRDWLTGAGFPCTESLPAPLQSRWIDATILPSAPLARDAVEAAATAEAVEFSKILGFQADVVVPPTFVWSSPVEGAWARAGLRVVVTPGRRCETRDANAAPLPADTDFFNGRIGAGDVLYVVRDSYFEPRLGHTHERALGALRAKTDLGRPTLLETHRMNFLDDDATRRQALREVNVLIGAALAEFPASRFMSTAELAGHYRERSMLVESRPAVRIHYLLRRLARVSRLRKLATVTGAAGLAWMTYVVTRPRWGAPVPE
jgi:hypothetical protein